MLKKLKKKGIKETKQTFRNAEQNTFLLYSFGTVALSVGKVTQSD